MSQHISTEMDVNTLREYHRRKNRAFREKKGLHVRPY